MLQIDRHNLILSYLKENGSGKVEELSKLVGVTPMTIRRDLEKLENLNLVTRIFGGAVIRSSLNVETSFKDKSAENIEKKKKIARKAIQYVKDGQIVLLDSGTTTLEIARLLKTFSSLTVVTTDVKIAGYLAMNTAFTILCTGGLVQNQTGACIGGYTTAFLNEFHVDVSFLGTGSIDKDFMLCSPSMEKAEVKKQIIHSSEQVVLVTDSSKFQKKSFIKVGHLSEMTVVIIDNELDQEIMNKILEQNINIIAI